MFQGTREEWQRVFYIHCSIMIVGAIGFGLLAKGEVQKWAVPTEGTEQKKETKDLLWYIYLIDIIIAGDFII